MKKTMTARQLAAVCKRACEDKKANDIRVMDVRKLSTFTDFFVICSGQSEPQLKAVAEGVEHGVREEAGVKPLGREGSAASRWLVVDFGEVVVHIFHEQARELYRLEDLWNDAKQV